MGGPSQRGSGVHCHGFLYMKNKTTTPWGGGNVPDEGGPKPVLGRGGVLREGSPLFFHTPMASSEIQKISRYLTMYKKQRKATTTTTTNSAFISETFI